MAGRFSILSIPGSGAQATVCIVRDAQEGGVRALKVLREDFEPDSMEARRVRDEGRILMRLRHPGLPRVHERLEIEGRQVLVMDFVDGPPLGWWLRHAKRVRPELAFGIARQVAEVVGYAYAGGERETGHPARLVHRDLNLSNILLDLSGRVKVLDFGLARAEFLDRESFTAVSLLGTPGFTAPEGLRAIADNPKLDVYSLGIAVLSMLAGHVPTLSQKPDRHGEHLERFLGQLVERVDVVSEQLDLVRRMCAHRPADRPGMDEVVAALPDRDALLSDWIRQTVLPVQRARPQTDPLVHSGYDELAFLEGIGTGEGEPDGPGRADQVVRRFMERPDWAQRATDLQWILARYPRWTAAPFLERLAPLTRSWWRRSGPLPEPPVVLLCLAVLSHRREPEVVELARTLARNRNPSVAALAGSILREEIVSLESVGGN